MYGGMPFGQDLSGSRAACDEKYIEGILEHLYYALSGVETECISVDESGVTVRGIPEYIVEPFRPLIFSIHRHYSDPALRHFISRYLSRLSEAIGETAKSCRADGSQKEAKESGIIISQSETRTGSRGKERMVISCGKHTRLVESAGIRDSRNLSVQEAQSGANSALERLLIAVQDEERMFADIERATSIVCSSLNALQELTARQNEFTDSYVHSSFVCEQARRRRTEVEMWMNYGEVLSEEELPRTSALAKTRMIVVSETMDPFADCFWKDKYRMRETGIPGAEAEAIGQAGKMVLLIRELVGREVVVDDSEELMVMGGRDDDITKTCDGDNSTQESTRSFYEEKGECLRAGDRTTSEADCSGHEQKERAYLSKKLYDANEIRCCTKGVKYADEDDEAADNDDEMIQYNEHTKETSSGAVCGRKSQRGSRNKSRRNCRGACTKRIRENENGAGERSLAPSVTEPRVLPLFRYGIDSVQRRRYELCAIFREELGSRINSELGVLFDVILMRDLSFFHHLMHELGKDLVVPLCDLDQTKRRGGSGAEGSNTGPGGRGRIGAANEEVDKLVDSECARQICKKVLFTETDGERRDLMRVSLVGSSLSDYVLRLLQSQRMPAPNAYITLAEALVVGINSRLLCFFFSQRFFAEIEMLGRFLFLGNFLLYQLDRKKKYNFVRIIYLIIRRIQERRNVKKVRIGELKGLLKELDVMGVAEVDEMVSAVERQVRELVGCFFLLSADVFAHISRLMDIALEYILLEYPEDADVDGFGRRVRETVMGLVEAVRRECGECELYEFLSGLDLTRIL